MNAYHFDMGNGDTVLVHGASSADEAHDVLTHKEPDYADEDYDVSEVNPDMGESQMLQYDRVFYT